jgi:uncharacterized protein YjdB
MSATMCTVPVPRHCGDDFLRIGRPAHPHRSTLLAILMSRLRSVTGLALILGSAFGIACADRGLPADPNTVAIAAISLSPSSAQLSPGQTQTVHVMAVDAQQQAIERRLLATWTTSDASVATVIGGVITGVAPGTALISATVDDKVGRLPVTVAPTNVASVRVSPGLTSLQTGDTASLTALVLDTAGHPISRPSVAWASTNRSIASVDSSGHVTAVNAGTVTVTATSGGRTGLATIGVRYAAVATLSITPASPTLEVGDVLQFTATSTDARGNPVPSTVDWRTSNPGVATVDTTGVVTALATGSSTLTAGTGGKESTLTFTVTTGNGVRVLTIAPQGGAPGDALPYGTPARITGTNFSSISARNAVTVGGRPALNVAVAPGDSSTLTFTMPSSGFGTCQATQLLPVTVTVTRTDRAKQGSKLAPISTAPQLRLAVGQSAKYTNAGALNCLEIPASGGDYTFAFFNAQDTLGTVRSVTLTGRAGNTTLAGDRLALSASPLVRPHGTPAAPQNASAPDLTGVRQRAEAHSRILMANDALVRRLRLQDRAALRATRDAVRMDRAGIAPAVQALAPAAALAAAVATPVVGDPQTVRFPSLTNLCQYTTVNARVVYVGPHSVMLEDNRSTTAGKVDSAYQRIGDEFENVMYPILTGNFGDPLTDDTQLSGTGRITMVMTPQVNTQGAGGIKGFVSTGDFMPRSACDASNQTETFYAMVPSSSTKASTDDWEANIRGTLIHEVKHLTAYAYRFKNASTSVTLETAWLEESLAMTVEELYAHQVEGYRQNQNVSYNQGLYCEVNRATDPGCATTPQIMLDHYFFLAQSLGDNERRSPIGKSASTDNSFYGSGWSLVRYVLDQSGRSESSMLQALTQTNRVGVDNLSTQAGRTWPDILGDYALAIATDDAGFAPLSSSITFPSWNLRDVFAGLSKAYGATGATGVFSHPYPLQPHSITYGSFSTTVSSIAGGSAAVFALTGTPFAPELFTIGSGTTGAIGSGLGLAIVRTR